jgi:hypothetical protein
MRHARWLDHLAPWLALGSVFAADIFSPREIALMGLPLLAALVVEFLRFDLGRWRRILELGALAVFLLLAFTGAGLVATVTQTLFTLCGARLALPRELPQRRQLLLMGFLLFLTTCLSSTEPQFLAWAAAWAGLGSLLLLEQAWDRSAQLRRGPFPLPPFRKALPWTLATLFLAVPFFVAMPRLSLGGRGFNFGLGRLGGIRAGFSEVLDLGLPGGPIGSNGEVVLRITPGSAGNAMVPRDFQADFALLRGIALENLDGQKWNANPRDLGLPLLRGGLGPTQEAEIFLYPSPTNLIPRPYLPFYFQGRLPVPTEARPGGGLVWSMVVRRGLPLKLHYRSMGPQGPVYPETAGRLRGPRRSALLQIEPIHEAAHRWSLQVAPGELPPRALAQALVAGFGSFRYALDNPSGKADNPLEDFLERSRAGHCEYFASSLALALRSRGVPARIVNGYRLGPYNDAGGYFLVTQNEAHSWVEYWDPEIEAWRVADPTPPAPPSPFAGGDSLARLRKWIDALEYHWDRHVVRFSDEDQMAGAAWAVARLDLMKTDIAASKTARLGAGSAGVLLVLLVAWRIWGRLPARGFRPKPPAFTLRALKPLLRRTRLVAPPATGETIRAWFMRLAALRPDRAEAIGNLLLVTERVAYGDQPDPGLKRMAAEEARHWA